MVAVKLLKINAEPVTMGSVDQLPEVIALRALMASSAAAASFIITLLEVVPVTPEVFTAGRSPVINLDEYSIALVMELAVGSVHREIQRVGGKVQVFGGTGAYRVWLPGT